MSFYKLFKVFKKIRNVGFIDVVGKYVAQYKRFNVLYAWENIHNGAERGGIKKMRHRRGDQLWR